MTVTTIRGNSADFYIRCGNASYSTANAGYGYVKTPNSDMTVGQSLQSGIYYVRRCYLPFDTSVIPDADAITNVDLVLTVAENNSTTDFTLYVYKYNFDAAEAMGNVWDMDAAGSIDDAAAAVKETAEAAITSQSQYSTVTLANLSTDWVNKTGYTRYALRSSRDVSETSPTFPEYVNFCSGDNGTEAYRPALVVTHGSGSGSSTISTIHSQGVLTPTPFMQLCSRLLPQRVARGIGAAVRAERPRQTLPHRPARCYSIPGVLPCKS